jgi:glycosyltransferase involved in cell wall biosynthesis
MSTYDGERHLREQVDSILDQRGVDVQLTVRDDGSSDGTVELLRDLGVAVEQGTNVGLPHAFFRLVEDSDGTADLWALSDQDDVWLPHKLDRAAQALAGVEGPGMYCARVLVTDEHLAPLYPHPLPGRGPSFANALVQNVATGCTIVLNRAARDVLRGRWPAYAVMHDAWLYLVLAGTGSVLYDAELVVQYRQHSANTVGMGRGRLSRVAGRVRRQLTPGGPGAHGRQDAELLRTHGNLLRPAARKALEDFLGSRRSLRSRCRYAVWGEAHRQTSGSDLVLKGLQVLDRVRRGARASRQARAGAGAADAAATTRPARSPRAPAPAAAEPGSPA